MTRSAATVTAFPGVVVLGRFVRALISLARAFKDRRDVMNLAECDERMLRDIGLTRDDVASALGEPLHRQPSWVLVRRVERRTQAPRPSAARKARPVVRLVSQA